MKHTGTLLAVSLLLAPCAALAQADHDRYGPAPYGDYSHRSADAPYGPERSWRSGDDRQLEAGHDWARVVRVDPVFEDQGHAVRSQGGCWTRRDGYVYETPGRHDGYYGRDAHGDGRYDGNAYGGQSRRDENGRMIATVIGGIAGAVLGSKVGDGSGRYVGTAVGSMVGGMAGRGIYEASRRQRDGSVTVCDPDPYGDVRASDGYGRDAYARDRDRGGYDRVVEQYDVTYEYAGRQYVTRTAYHPGDRIRVRVDVRAE